MASARIAAPLKWHGGKHYLAPRIVDLMPPHTHYVEPYAGGLSVLLAKDPEGVSEVVNDINGELTNFWFVLQDDHWFQQMQRKLEAVPFSENEFLMASLPTLDPVDRAVSFFIRCRQSLAGRMQDFAPLSRTRTRRGMNEQASAWLAAIDGLPAVHARLKRVAIMNRDAPNMIQSQDGEKTLFYCDPPYLKETRAAPEVYEHEMTLEQHEKLLNVLGSIEGRFMLSGYRSALYDLASNTNNWNRHDFDLPNNAAGGTEKRRMTECLWCNF